MQSSRNLELHQSNKQKPRNFMRVQEEKSKAAAERQRHAKRCGVPQDWGEERFKGR